MIDTSNETINRLFLKQMRQLTMRTCGATNINLQLNKRWLTWQ